ncbi:hypothetical protein Tco_1513370, partial [Tanacetum coccineum]
MTDRSSCYRNSLSWHGMMNGRINYLLALNQGEGGRDATAVLKGGWGAAAVL